MSEIQDRLATLSAEQRAALRQRIRQQGAVVEACPERYDVVLLGGGLAGLTLALQIQQSRPGSRIVVIEKQGLPFPEATHKVGESTGEIASRYLRDVLGLAEHLQHQQLRKFGLRMFFTREKNQDITRRVELGSTVLLPLRTYQLDRGRLENALSDMLPRQGITLLPGCKIQRVLLRPEDIWHQVWLRDADGQRVIRARRVVDATGRRSLLKRQPGLAKSVGHRANAVWFRVAYPIDINTWSAKSDWLARIPLGDRALSTNHLMGSGYRVWLIRLASGSTSVGIVTDAATHRFAEMNRFDRALSWLYRHEPQCAAEIEAHRELVQDFRVMRDYSYTCSQVFSGERWCLVGEAGVALDPLYSPGSDLIAIGNGQACDLICRQLDGEDIRIRAQVYDRFFLSVAQIWLSIYEQQYPLMDTAQIMTTKIIWDIAFYWGTFGLLYFHDAFCTIAERPQIATNFARVAQLSNRIQAFFREWHVIDQPEAADHFVDLYAPHEFMVKLHTGMDAGLSPREVETQFAENVQFLERLAGQIASTVIEASANQAEQRDAWQQIQRWQTEPYLAALIARSRRERRIFPVNRSWIAFKYQQAEQFARWNPERMGI